ncbi:MAG: glycoside hydrolase family 88 protein [Kiritimatiellae bacterium]|nr:glycoside hydrolase family 88 protein [Kiritimatiellia bacterium]
MTTLPLYLTIAGVVAVAPPAPEEIRALAMRVADWQLATPSRHAPTDWTKAALYAGLMHLSRSAPDARYHDAMLAMGKFNQWQLGPRPYHADDHAVGQTYAELFRLHRNPAMIAPMRERFDWIIAHPKDDDLSFQRKDKTDRWSWCDALFMAPPAWARLALVTGDRRYLDFANRLWWVTSDYLYDREEHLFYRDDRYFAQREANGRKVFWSRGNGWVLAGLARMLQVLPADYPDRPRYERQYLEMAAAVRAVQPADGMWRSSLLDPEAYPLPEASGTGFFTFALAWGLNEGLLARPAYEDVVWRAWAGLVRCVRDDGRLAHVQPIGADPKRFDPEHSDVYGVGAFLLAATELYRLAGGRLRPADELPPGAATADREPPLPAVVPATTNPVAQPARDVPRAWGRHVPERKDDIAWENDRIAYRIYGPALEATGELSSGIDVWVKRTRRPVIDDWYRSGDYHRDHGEGGDFYKVGRSCGCGGTAVWHEGRLHFANNWVRHRFLRNGPDVVEFEADYAPWRVGERTVAETRRISLRLGSNFNRIESRFSTDPPGDLTVAIGIVERTGEGRARWNREEGWLSYWEPESPPNGSIACAVWAPPDQIEEIRRAEGHHLVLVRVPAGRPLVYAAGAGWSKGDFPTPDSWEQYVREFARRAREGLQ